jgi:O-antigen/teichoic acid export membrane protein
MWRTPSVPSFSRRFVTSSIAALSLKVGGAALSFLMFVALARAMSFEQFGVFSFAFSLSTVLAKIGVAGQQQFLLRDLPRHIGGGEGDARARSALTARSFLAVLAVSCLLMVALLLALALPGTSDGSGRTALVFAAILIPFLAFSELLTGTLRAYGAIVLALAPREIMWRGAICIVCFGIALAAGPVLSAWQSFALCAGLLAGLTLAQAAASSETRVWQQLSNRASFGDRAWITASGQFAVTSTVTFGVPMLSVVVIGIMLSPAETGPFFAALKSSQIMNLLLMATALVASPLISRAFSRGEMVRVQKICAACAGVGAGFAVCVFALFVLFGNLVLGLFGDGFAAGYPELVILSLAYVINAACGANGAVLEMTQHQDRFMRLILFSNLIGLCLLPVLTWLYGTIGAAVAVAGTLILWNLLATIAARRYVGVDPSVFGIFRLNQLRAGT